MSEYSHARYVHDDLDAMSASGYLDKQLLGTESPHPDEISLALRFQTSSHQVIQ